MTTESELLAKLDAAISRISSLEGELRNKPKAKEEASPPPFDLVRFRQAFITDPVGTMGSLQITAQQAEHVRQTLEVHSQGDRAPLDMRMRVAQGPQMMAVQANAEALATLSRRLDEQDKAKTDAAKKESFKTIAANKEKYPNLAKAAAADPDYVNKLEKHGGTAEEFAAAQEAELSKLAALFAPQTASENAGNIGQSSQTKPTPLAANLNGDVPAVQQTNPGAWTREAAQKLQNEIVQKYARPKV